MKKDQILIKHILEAFDKVERYIKDVRYVDFVHNDMMMDAVIRELA